MVCEEEGRVEEGGEGGAGGSWEGEWKGELGRGVAWFLRWSWVVVVEMSCDYDDDERRGGWVGVDALFGM